MVRSVVRNALWNTLTIGTAFPRVPLEVTPGPARLHPLCPPLGESQPFGGVAPPTAQHTTPLHLALGVDVGRNVSK